MLKMVAPEASYEEISGQILQNRDSQVGENLGGTYSRNSRGLGTGLGVLGQLSGGHGEYWTGPWMVSEASSANPEEILRPGMDLGPWRAGRGWRGSDVGPACSDEI